MKDWSGRGHDCIWQIRKRSNPCKSFFQHSVICKYRV